MMYVKFAQLPVYNQDRAIKFYTENFDCEVVTNKPYGDNDWRWIELAFSGAQTNLQFGKRANDEASDDPALVLVEQDVVEVVHSLRNNGVEIITEPKEAPWEPGKTFAEFRDSEGNRIVIGSA